MKQFSVEKQQTALFVLHGAFFAFSQEQFTSQADPDLKYVSIGAGLIAPEEKKTVVGEGLAAINKTKIDWELENNTKKEIIWYELANHECQIVGHWEQALEALDQYSFTEEQVKAEWVGYYQHCADNDLF